MKIRIGNGMFLVLAMSLVGAAAQAQSGVVGELSKGLSNPSAGPTPEPVAKQVTVASVPDNGAQPGDSHVRIVRLSDVKGMLALDRKTGAGFEQTMQNMPIVEGERLQTSDGYAEVEFEDNTTLRLAPNSRVEFSLLALRSSGAKASTINVVQGTVYVSTEGTKGNEFVLVSGDTKMMVAPSTHLRLVATGKKPVLSVFSGSVDVERGALTTVVAKKQSLALGSEEMTVAKKVAEEPYDAWDKQSIDYQAHYSKANAFAGGGNSFGLSDLNYYGSFVNAGGCGQMWQPYMVSSAWSPYANGVWAYYPGAGYSWVSPYPWGWLPYHSGSWGFCQGVGWGWQPGNNWYGLNNYGSNNIANGGIQPGVGGGRPTSTFAGSTMHSPLRQANAPQPPVAGATRASLVLSNQKPIVFSQADKSGNFVFQRDSAGLGVPRGSLGNLNHVSNDVGRHGSASMPVYATAPGGETGFAHGASRGPATLHAGSPGDGQSGQLGMQRGSSSASSGSSSGASSGSRQGSFEGAQGAQGSGSFHGGGGAAPGGGGAPMSPGGNSGGGGGGRNGSAAAPK